MIRIIDLSHPFIVEKQRILPEINSYTVNEYTPGPRVRHASDCGWDQNKKVNETDGYFLNGLRELGTNNRIK